VTLFKPQEEVDPIRHQRLVDASIALPGALITAWWHMFRASEPSGDLSTTSLRTREWLAEKVKDTDESVRAVVAAAEQDAYLPLRSPRWTLSGLWRNLKRHNLPILSIAILAGAPHVVGLIFIGLGAYAASFIWKQHLPYRNRMASAA
jgi:hypothetical protein